MERQKAADDLNVIRQLMERPIRYSTQSGLSGIVAGCAALLGLAGERYFSGLYRAHPHSAMWVNMAVWAGVLVVAFAGAVILTRLRERARGMPFWSNVKMRILRTILPPAAAALGLTLVIVFRPHLGVRSNEWGLIPAIWMLFYGVTLWQVGEFSVREVRLLGVAFILAGLLAGAFCRTPPLPYAALGVTFGGFHIIYGLIVWRRHGG